MVKIVESGMVFGPFQDWEVFRIEQSRLLQKCNGSKTVEFIYRKKKNMLYFIEAKQSSAVISKGNKENYERFLTEIKYKFEDSFDLLMTALLGRRDDHGEINATIKKIDYEKLNFYFFLIIKGHEETWLPPLREELEKRLKHFLTIWNGKLIVLNDKLALEEGIISGLDMQEEK